MDAKDRRKIHPKVRMISNGSSAVNAVRSELSAGVCMSETASVPEQTVRGSEAPAEQLDPAKAEKKSQDFVPHDVMVSIFVHTTNGKDIEGMAAAGVQDHVKRGTLQTATLHLNKIEEIAKARNVTHLELGEPLSAPTPHIASTTPERPRDDLRTFGDPAAHEFGKDVLIGIIDVGGFDFAHEDFIDPVTKKTRWVRIWDQGAAPKRPPKVLDFHAGYGHEITQQEMNEALEASARLKVPATRLEPQTQMSPASHGTHVASVAAGNTGICRNAMIAGVLIALAPDDLDRRLSFYDSTRIAHAVDYLIELSKQLRDERGRPVSLSINVSLGTNGHAHDASSAISRWLDNAMTTPGRCISVAAGNRGRKSPSSTAISASSSAASTRAAGSERAASITTSSGSSSATAGPTSRRTSSRSGIRRRTASPYRFGLPAANGRASWSRGRSCRTTNCPTRAS